MTVYGALGGAGSGARDEQAEKRRMLSRLVVELCEKIDREQKTFKKKRRKR